MSSSLQSDKPALKWYLHPAVIIIALLVAGPFAIPLVWMSPALKRWHKIAATVLISLLTVWIIMASIDLFRLLLKEMRDLQAVLK